MEDGLKVLIVSDWLQNLASAMWLVVGYWHLAPNRNLNMPRQGAVSRLSQNVNEESSYQPDKLVLQCCGADSSAHQPLQARALSKEEKPGRI